MTTLTVRRSGVAKRCAHSGESHVYRTELATENEADFGGMPAH